MALATAYDAVNAAIFLPSGGSRRLRQALVDALDVRPGTGSSSSAAAPPR